MRKWAICNFPHLTLITGQYYQELWRKPRANIPDMLHPFCWDLPENVRVQNAILLYHPLQAEVGMVRGQRARTQAWMVVFLCWQSRWFKKHHVFFFVCLAGDGKTTQCFDIVKRYEHFRAKGQSNESKWVDFFDSTNCDFVHMSCSKQIPSPKKPPRKKYGWCLLGEWWFSYAMGRCATSFLGRFHMVFI